MQLEQLILMYLTDPLFLLLTTKEGFSVVVYGCLGERVSLLLWQRLLSGVL